MEEDRYTRITLRIPRDVHSQLQQAADNTSKSMNAEIVARLEESFSGAPGATSTRGNEVLLRAMADFVVLRHSHPEVMASMEESMVKMARSIKGADDDTKLMEVAGPWLKEYAFELADAVNQVTELLGPGWAKEVTSGKPAAPKKPAL